MSIDGRRENGWGCEVNRNGDACYTHPNDEPCPTRGTVGLIKKTKKMTMYNVTLSVSVESPELATEAMIKLNNVMAQMMRDPDLAGDKSMYTGIHSSTEEVEDED